MFEVKPYLYLFILYATAYACGVWVAAAFLSFHLVWLPLTFKYSDTFRRCLIFGNFVRWPLNVEFEKPSTLGLVGARNFCIEFMSAIDKCVVKIGVWHILPKSDHRKLDSALAKSDALELETVMNAELSNTEKPIVFYCHGKMSSRAATHRLNLYRLLQKMDCHIIAYDYRGYGDSSNINPTRDGVVEDAANVYAWLHNLLNRNGVKPQIYVWGHSLGAAIASHMIGDLESLSSRLQTSLPLPKPTGIILEAPFNNIVDEITHHFASKMVNFLPYYNIMFVEPFRVNEKYKFEPDKYLLKDDCSSIPVLMMHSRDDEMVPFALGRKLYEGMSKSRENGGGAAVVFHGFGQVGGNRWICLSPQLPSIIRKFLDSCSHDKLTSYSNMNNYSAISNCD